MKRFLLALRGLGIGVGVILISYLLQTKPVSSFIKAHAFYFVGLVLLLQIVLVLGIYWAVKKFQSLSEQKRNAQILQSLSEQKSTSYILKPRPDLISKKNLLFLLLAFICYAAILICMLYFMDEMPFPSWIKTNFSYLLSLAFIIAISVYNYVYTLKSDQKLKRSVQEKEIVTLKLRSIRSQLNPHFMFNALTSIQGLMNKNDIVAANHYLTLFADLTRKVLNTSDQDLISLDDELKILDDYLQMEQLRFGFQYQVTVDENINIANTEIPAMLLQPFVENAVKHGVAMLQQNGSIQVQVNKQANNLALSVTDNGKGFNPDTALGNTGSLGLKLSKERIKLLSLVHPDQPVTLNINPTKNGTIIIITLQNLL